MADLRPINGYPEHLDSHNVSEQELIIMTPQQQALAKDWSIQKRRTEWLLVRHVELHNIVVEQDRLLNILRAILMLSGLIGASGGGIFVILKYLI